MEIYTIGHSTMKPEQFISLVRKFNIKQAVDVRSIPGSKKFPWFNKEYKRMKNETIEEFELKKKVPLMPVWLNVMGMKYFHIPELGGRRYYPKTVDCSIAGAWRVDAFKFYGKYMQEDSFELGLQLLLKIAEKGPTVYFCCEHTPLRCHRRMISDALVSRDISVLHIKPNGKLDPHVLTDFAIINNNKVTYPII